MTAIWSARRIRSALFVGKSGAGTLVVKQNIDAVTGATVSTKGVTKGVNAALAAAEAMN